MYGPLKNTLLSLLRAPKEPPEAPAGTHASTQTFRASPRYLTYRLLVFYLSSAGALIGLTVGGIATAQEEGWVGLGLLALSGGPLIIGLLAGWFSVRIDYDLRYYIVTDRSLRVREGAWTVKEKTITYANVQNLRVVQGPLQRLFKIWDLKIDTAGGGGANSKEKGASGSHSVNMAGIEDAHAVRDLILSYLKQATSGSGLGDPDDIEHGPRATRAAPPLASPAVVDALQASRESARELHHAARDAAQGA